MPSTPLLVLLLCTTPPPEPTAAGASSGQQSPSETAAWAQWRGPTRDGRVAADGPAWPERLTKESLAVAWRVEGLGPSYSGPVVAEGRVFSVETRDEEREVVRAFDRATGAELWNTDWDGAMKVPFFAAKNGSWVRSTPAVADGRIYVAGMRDVLVCLDAGTGEERWRADFPERLGTPLPDFGFVCSPLVEDGAVYVQAGASLVRLDAATGEILWRSLNDAGGMNGSAFSSPVLGTLAGAPQVVVQTRTRMAGVAPADGAVLWERPIEAFRGMNILTPSLVNAGGDAGEGVFTASYGGRAQLLSVARGEEGYTAEPSWDNRVQGYMSSPVLLDGHAYIYSRANRFSCVRLSDGETAWTSPPIGDDYWSLALQGERILALSNEGVLRMIAATPEAYRVLGEVEIADAPTWAHVAPAGGQVFVREQNALVALHWNAK